MRRVLAILVAALLSKTYEALGRFKNKRSLSWYIEKHRAPANCPDKERYYVWSGGCVEWTLLESVVRKMNEAGYQATYILCDWSHSDGTTVSVLYDRQASGG